MGDQTQGSWTLGNGKTDSRGGFLPWTAPLSMSWSVKIVENLGGKNGRRQKVLSQSHNLICFVCLLSLPDFLSLSANSPKSFRTHSSSSITDHFNRDESHNFPKACFQWFVGSTWSYLKTRSGFLGPWSHHVSSLTRGSSAEGSLYNVSTVSLNT